MIAPESDFSIVAPMAVQLAQINLTNLPARRTIETQPRTFRGNRGTNGGIEPKITVRCVPRVPDTDHPLCFTDGLGRHIVAGPLFEHIQAAVVRAHVRIMRTCGHRSSCRYLRSVLPTLGGYRAGMPKARSRKAIASGRSQKSKIGGDGHNELPLTAESALPPAPSVKRRLHRDAEADVKPVQSVFLLCDQPRRPPLRSQAAPAKLWLSMGDGPCD
jgi:hypothetical protein